jgi:putative aminopeptidase FrvX
MRTHSVQNSLLEIARSLLKYPSAPFREQAVREYILNFCRQRGIQTAVDAMGNIRAEYGRRRSKSLVFVAHTDHPGFIIEKNSVRNRTTAIFYGGVEKEYFRRHTAIRVFTSDGSVKGRIQKVHFDKKNREKRVWLSVEKPVGKGSLAMWDLPACRIRGDKLYSRACDDILGCASILALLDELHRRRIRKDVIGLFTVAEEPGLHGTKYAAMKGLIPKDAIVISIETSSVLPTVPIGKGVVVRVGDRSNIFHPGVIKWMLDIAKKVQSQDKTFQFQRKLMDGGTCEASIFSTFGYTAGALCIPLGNYHNRDRKRKKIAAEFVSCRDLQNMVKLFLSLVQTGVSGVKLIPKPPRYEKRRGTLGEVFWE